MICTSLVFSLVLQEEITDSKNRKQHKYFMDWYLWEKCEHGKDTIFITLSPFILQPFRPRSGSTLPCLGG
jgi:hypothetical protein